MRFAVCWTKTAMYIAYLLIEHYAVGYTIAKAKKIVEYHNKPPRWRNVLKYGWIYEYDCHVSIIIEARVKLYVCMYVCMWLFYFSFFFFSL